MSLNGGTNYFNASLDGDSDAFLTSLTISDFLYFKPDIDPHYGFLSTCITTDASDIVLNAENGVTLSTAISSSANYVFLRLTNAGLHFSAGGTPYTITYANLALLNGLTKFPIVVDTTLQNIYCGGGAFASNTTGSYNTAIGASALNQNQTGIENFSLGALSLRSNIVGSYNVGIGVSALANNNSNYNTAIGRYCLYGCNAPDNVCIGYFGGVQIGSGASNAAVGNYSLYNLTSGSNNTGLGHYNGTGLVSGNNNSFFGAGAGMASPGTYSNSTAIGFGSTITASNQIVLGTTSETTRILGALTVTGAATFSTAPTMSGANIAASSIPITALVSTAGFVTTTGAQSIAGAKTFTSTPVFSNGIVANSVTASAVQLGAILSSYQRSSLNSCLFVTTDAYTIQPGDPEIIVLNSASITSINLPSTSSSSVGAKYTIIKGQVLNGVAITVVPTGGLIFNTQFNQSFISTSLSATCNYATLACVNSLNSQTAYDWVLYQGQDYSAGTFNLGGNSYISSQDSTKIVSQNVTIQLPYSQHYSIQATSAIAITLPRIANAVTSTSASGAYRVLTSQGTGLAITLRRTGIASLTAVHTLNSYGSGFYKQEVFSTSNAAITSWNNYRLSLVPMSYIKASVACTIASTGVITPSFSIAGTVDLGIFVPNAITTATASISGTTLTLSATNASVAIGQVIGATGVINGTYIVSGSGLSWVVGTSQTVTSRVMSFYNANMKPTIILYNSVSPTVGYTISGPNVVSYIWPTSLTYSATGAPQLATFSTAVASGTGTYNFYPLCLYESLSTSTDVPLPLLSGTGIPDNVFFKVSYSLTNGAPSIQYVYNNPGGTYTATSVNLLCYGWFQE